MKAYQIADWLIAHNNAVMKYNSADALSNTRIQRLLYFFQGCSLAFLGEALFEEDILARKQGPIVDSVYQKYLSQGNGQILETPAYPDLKHSIELLLINAYNAFGKFSTWELTNQIYHQDPWKCTKCEEALPLEAMKDFFLAQYPHIHDRSQLRSNIQYLQDIAEYEYNWDEEEGNAFDPAFIREMIDLVSTMTIQPEIKPTGHNSIVLEFGFFGLDQDFLELEICENNPSVSLYFRKKDGTTIRETIGIEDVNWRMHTLL